MKLFFLQNVKCCAQERVWQFTASGGGSVCWEITWKFSVLFPTRARNRPRIRALWSLSNRHRIHEEIRLPTRVEPPEPLGPPPLRNANANTADIELFLRMIAADVFAYLRRARPQELCNATTCNGTPAAAPPPEEAAARTTRLLRREFIHRASRWRQLERGTLNLPAQGPRSIPRGVKGQGQHYRARG